MAALNCYFLRLKYESRDSFSDDLDSGNILETVQSMLIQMSGKHLTSHFANNKLQQEIVFKTEVLETFKRNIFKGLQVIFYY